MAQAAPGAQVDDSGATFYGSTGLENAYYIDGANTTGIELGEQGTTLNFEFIDEVQVKTGSYSAEYGRATGSVINVITKSGGNEFHGDVFGYYDSPSTQASLKGDAVRGPITATSVTKDFTRSDFGADLGGYIVKDKLWFFAAYNRVDNENKEEVTQDFSTHHPGCAVAGRRVHRSHGRRSVCGQTDLAHCRQPLAVGILLCRPDHQFRYSRGGLVRRHSAPLRR